MRRGWTAFDFHLGETMNFHTTTDRQRQRKEMTDDIIQQVRDAVREELADAPGSFSQKAGSVERIVLTRLSVAAKSVDGPGLIW